MTLSELYLICFIVGFSLSVFSVMNGMLHHGHGGMQHVHAHLPIFNLGSFSAFLAWFGGIGFLLSRFSGIWLWLVFLLAVSGGLIGGAIVLVFLKALLSRERPLDPMDYEMVGVLGLLTSGIREKGIGEITFSQEGARRSVPARSDEGGAIAKGVDVLVTRYENGIAYVRRWDDLNGSKETI